MQKSANIEDIEHFFVLLLDLLGNPVLVEVVENEVDELGSRCEPVPFGHKLNEQGLPLAVLKFLHAKSQTGRSKRSAPTAAR